MFTHDFWITPEGTFEMGAHEHVDMALKAMLRLDTESSIPQSWYFGPIPAKILKEARKRGAPEKDLEYLSRESNDPRTYMIVKYGWIRVARGKFNLQEFNQDSLDLIQKAKLFWETEKPEPEEMIDIDELVSGSMFPVSVKNIRRRGATPAALKNLGTGVGAWRNPDSEYYLLVQMPRSGKWKVFSNHMSLEAAQEALTEAENMGQGYTARIARDDDPIVREYLGE
jgi:hypothetical protein